MIQRQVTMCMHTGCYRCEEPHRIQIGLDIGVLLLRIHKSALGLSELVQRQEWPTWLDIRWVSEEKYGGASIQGEVTIGVSSGGRDPCVGKGERLRFLFCQTGSIAAELIANLNAL